MANTKNYNFYNFFTKLAHKHIVDLFANSMEFESAAVVYDAVNKEVSMIHKDVTNDTTICSIKLKPEFSYEDSEKKLTINFN